MRTIYKYPLVRCDLQTIPMPAGAKILAVQTQHDLPYLWAMVDSGSPPEPRDFRTYGTGHDVDQEGDYIGTYQLRGGALVFHVFEVAHV